MSQALQAESGETFWKRHRATVKENSSHHSLEGVGWAGRKVCISRQKEGSEQSPAGERNNEYLSYFSNAMTKHHSQGKL